MYKLISQVAVQRLCDGACIPADQDNQDWVAYQQWLADGNVPEPADLPSPAEGARAALALLEQETMMNRVIRELAIVSMQDLAAREADRLTLAGTPTTASAILASRPGWIKLQEVDAEALRLRRLLA